MSTTFPEDAAMDLGAVVNQGLTGMQRSQTEMLRSAQQIAEAGTTQRNNPEKNDVVAPLVNLEVQSHIFDASAKVVKTANETIGTLLNIKA
jgi:flagellar hook protein FlgE